MIRLAQRILVRRYLREIKKNKESIGTTMIIKNPIEIKDKPFQLTIEVKLEKR